MHNHTAFHKTVSFIVVLLIVILTLASVINIYEQTTNYHHGLQIWLIAAGFAASFSVTVYIVMIARTKTTKIVAGLFALVFGFISGLIQTELYGASGASQQIALAYGYGVPAFEAALAILEALLNMEFVSMVKPQDRKPGAFSILANAAVNRIATQLQSLPSQQVAIATAPVEVQPAKTIEILPQAREALGMQENGMTIAEIATQLRKSERTISNYLKQAKDRRAIVPFNGLNGSH